MLALELIGDTNYFASNQLVTHAATVHVIPLDLDDAQRPRHQYLWVWMAPAPGHNCYPSGTSRIFEWLHVNDMIGVMDICTPKENLVVFPCLFNHSFNSWQKEVALIRLEFIQAKLLVPSMSVTIIHICWNKNICSHQYARCVFS